MASASSLTGFIKFISRTGSAWSDDFEAVLAEHVVQACDKWGVEPGEIAELLGEHQSMTLWGCALEDFMTRQYEGGRNAVDDYLKRRGLAESGGAKRYMRALRGAAMSLYEVSDVLPGQSFLARDLIRGGEPVRVSERSGSQQLKQWDRIAARVVQLGSEWQMAGGALMFDRQTSEFIMDTLRSMGDEAPPLERAAPVFSTIWLDGALESVLNPQLPQFKNTDGDPFVICASTIPLLPGATPAQCRAALAKVSGLQKKSTKLFDWVDPAAEPSEKRPPQTKDAIVLMTENSEGETVLGSIEIKKGALVLSTNSRERAARGEAMIAAALHGLAADPVRDETSAEDVLAKKEQQPARRPRKPRAKISSEEARAIIHNYLNQHYRRTLDEPIPMLGGVSPREAARTPEGRAEVVRWLKEMENRAARTSGDEHMTSYDFGWMWRELGLAELRA